MSRRVTTNRIAAVLGAVSAALVVSAVVAWVDVLSDREAAVASQPAAVDYLPPKVEIDPATGVSREEVTAYVDALADDPRGWRVDLDRFTLRIVPAGESGTEPMPGIIGRAWLDEGVVIVSDEAWTTLGPKFEAAGATLDDQRAWVVLHEIGHLLGHDHVECQEADAPAPVMRATTYGLGECALNVWPNPAT